MKYCIGKYLREIRKNQRMTMKEVALKVGVTESLISQIETDKVSPGIDTLLTIAEVLNINLDYLFSKLKKNREASVILKNDRKCIIDGDVRYELISKLDKFNSENSIEAYYLEVQSGEVTQGKKDGHIGKELGIIISGKAEMLISGKNYVLQAGDSITFDSDEIHTLKNIGRSILKAYWIITPPKRFF
ncbi:MAG TPA: helix-turn-helix domain-containing protein [Victivallales bacterium]|nr:helix-turn-helix domain-containing protein [Victivallales bacterium]